MRPHLQAAVTSGKSKMKRTISKIFISVFTVFMLLLTSCSSPTSPSNNSNNDNDSTSQNEQNQNEEKQRLYNNLVQLLRGKTFKETTGSAGYYNVNDTIDWVSNGYQIYFTDNQFIITKSPSYSQSVDFSPFNIKNISLENNNQVYFITFNDNRQRTLYVHVTPLLSCNYTDEILGMGLYYDSSSNNNSGNGPSASDIQSFIQGTWNYSVLQTNGTSQNCTVIFNNGNVSSTHGNVTQNGTYTVSNGKINLSFTYTVSSQSSNYSGSFNIELGTNNTFTLSPSSNTDSGAFALFFGLTNASTMSITFTK